MDLDRFPAVRYDFGQHDEDGSMGRMPCGALALYSRESNDRYVLTIARRITYRDFIRYNLFYHYGDTNKVLTMVMARSS